MLRARFAICAATMFLLAIPVHGAGAETVIRTILYRDIVGLMPGIGSDLASATVMAQVYEGLVASKDDGSTAPMLAEKIDVSADGLTYTFTLRPGVKFHNGQPLTAKEVIWTWRTFLDPKSNWPCRSVFNSNLVKVVSVDEVGDMQVAFRLDKPSGAFLSALARPDCDGTGIAHPDSVTDGAWTKAIGTGPFRLTQWRKGESVELAKFESYSSRTEPSDGQAGAKEARVDRVRFAVVTDPAAARAALQAGSIDVWYELAPNIAKELSTVKGIKVEGQMVPANQTLLINTQDPVLKDPRVRRALNLAIDRKGMTEALWAGYSRPAGTIVPVASAYYSTVEKQEFSYNPEEAKRLLKEAGYNGQPITVLSSPAVLGAETPVAVQAQLSAVGINAKVEMVDAATQASMFYKNEYQVTVWTITPLPDQIWRFDRMVGTKAEKRDSHWTNPQAATLVAAMFKASSAEERKPIVKQFNELFLSDPAMIPWAARMTFVAYHDNVSGFRMIVGRTGRFWNTSIKQ